LVRQCTRTLARGAPLVVVSEVGPARQAPALDVVAGASLHAATWQLLLGRAGFVQVQPLAAPGDGDGRFGVTAAMPS
jgi:hypothetical protein